MGKIQWKNGDKCLFKNGHGEFNPDHEARYVSYDEHAGMHVIFFEGYHTASDDDIKSSLTAEERLIRDASSMLTMQGFGHDQILLKCLLNNGYLKPKAGTLLTSKQRLSLIDDLSDFIDNLSPSAKDSSQHSAAAIVDFINRK